MRFCDALGDELRITEDENENILNIKVLDDSNDDGTYNSASFVLDKEQAKHLVNYLKRKWNI